MGENITDGGTMLMKRAGEEKKKRKKLEGRRARQTRRDGQEAKGSEEKKTCLFP